MMSDLQIIEGLTAVVKLQADIINAQTSALAQMGAVVMEEERAEASRAITALIGHDEAQDL